MPIVSRNIILDEYITDDNYVLLVDKYETPLYCVLHDIDPISGKKKSIVMGAFKNNTVYFIYTRTSIIGLKGRISQKEYPTIEKCVNEFIKKFKALTENNWFGCLNFKPRGKAILFSLGEPASVEKEEENSDDEIESGEIITIEPKVIEFLELISSKETIFKTLTSLNISIEKSGKCERREGIYIPPNNIIKAKARLYKHYLDLEEKSDVNPVKETQFYYSLIPVIKKEIKLIETKEDILEKLEELETLENITFSISLLSREIEIKQKVTPGISKSVLNLYHNLGYNITETKGIELSKIRDYIFNSIGSTHRFKLKIENIVSLHNPEKEKIFLDKYGKERRELLFHGSQLVNWISIITRGLLLNPSKFCSQITGKMFGNGIYWANSVSKSAQYCNKNSSCKEKIIIALGDVALGREKKSHSYENINRDGYDTVYGVGKYTYEKYEELIDGLYIPVGPLKYINAKNSLHYDEKVIYDQDRYLFRYLVVFEMN